MSSFVVILQLSFRDAENRVVKILQDGLPTGCHQSNAHWVVEGQQQTVGLDDSETLLVARDDDVKDPGHADSIVNHRRAGDCTTNAIVVSAEKHCRRRRPCPNARRSIRHRALKCPSCATRFATGRFRPSATPVLTFQRPQFRPKGGHFSC